MIVIENCNSLSDLRQKLIDGEEVRTVRQEPKTGHWIALEEWKKDFKRFINELLMPKDDYNGIMEYIDELPVTPSPKTGEWIGDAKTYYEELNKRGLGVDEYTPYFTDDIACSECLAKYSVLDNETQFFKYCPNCGCHMVDLQERSE